MKLGESWMSSCPSMLEHDNRELHKDLGGGNGSSKAEAHH